jgi:transcriptional regulator with XRE-family HTH domain
MADRDSNRELAERFGRNVFRARRQAGLSQEDLRIRAAVHRTHIGMVERGLRLARLDTIIKLAGGIEADPCELLDGLSWAPAGVGPGRFYVVGERRTSLSRHDKQGDAESIK